MGEAGGVRERLELLEPGIGEGAVDAVVELPEPAVHVHRGLDRAGDGDGPQHGAAILLRAGQDLRIQGELVTPGLQPARLQERGGGRHERPADQRPPAARGLRHGREMRERGHGALGLEGAADPASGIIEHARSAQPPDELSPGQLRPHGGSGVDLRGALLLPGVATRGERGRPQVCGDHESRFGHRPGAASVGVGVRTDPGHRRGGLPQQTDQLAQAQRLLVQALGELGQGIGVASAEDVHGATVGRRAPRLLAIARDCG